MANKTMVAFRFSPETIRLLEAESQRTGLDKTAFLELLVRRCAGLVPDAVRRAIEEVERTVFTPLLLEDDAQIEAVAAQALQRALADMRRKRTQLKSPR